MPAAQLQQTPQQLLAERLARLARQERGEVVDGDDAERGVVQHGDGDGGAVEGRGGAVDWDGVERRGGVAGDL